MIDLLDLQDKMQEMHLTSDTIADYIEALKGAQKKAKCAKNPVSNKYLVMVATKAVMGSQRLPQADDDWEDLDPLNMGWATWQELYLKADNRELLRRQVMGTGEKCGSAATHTTLAIGREPPTGNGRPVPSTLEDVEGCFDSLAGVVATESATLAELVKANAALVASNATLTSSNATLTTSNAKLTKALAESKGGGGGGSGRGGGGRRGETKHCPNCKRDT